MILPADDGRRKVKGRNLFAGVHLVAENRQRVSVQTASASEPLRLPDVSGLALLEAALAYAEAGWFVLPTDPADIKNPGSVVRGKWHEKSSRDADQIRNWWTTNPQYGIALHCGRSGAGVFDLDQDSLDLLAAYGRADLADALRSAAAWQGTRRNGDRGHYLFAVPDGHDFGNSAGGFMPFGEYRGRNGVIIAAPTPHPDAETKGGQYRQVVTGELSVMPEVLRACLSEATDSADPLSDTELDEFMAAHTGDGCGRDACRNVVDGVVKRLQTEMSDRNSRYDGLVAVSVWAMSEARAGCYAAVEAIDALRATYFAAFDEGDGPVRLAKRDGEFPRVLRWAAAQSDPGRAHRNDDTLTPDDLEAFWSARTELAQLRQFARARRVGPWSTLGVVLVRAVAAIPPNVVLPPKTGSVASLNLFVALVAPSGGGKGASEAAAGDFLVSDTDLWVATPGSGEGLLKQYAYVQKATRGQPPRQVNLRNSVVLTVGEVDSLTALAGRSGSTLMPELRKAWMGERLGFGYAAAEKAVTVMEHRYRMTMVVGVQPGRGGALLGEQDGGTPQRFVWLPATDPDAPDDPPDEPEPLRLPQWPAPPRTEDGPTLKFGSEVDEYQLNSAPVKAAFDVLALPPSVIEAIDSWQKAKLRGQTSRENDLDSHAMLARLKIAAALMWLNGRTDKVSEEDWDLAGVVLSMSAMTRRSVQSELRTKAEGTSRARGRQDAEREVARDDLVHEKRTAKLVEKVREKLREENDQSRNAFRKRFQSSDRAMVDDVIELLSRAGDVELRTIDYQGNPGQILHLQEGR